MNIITVAAQINSFAAFSCFISTFGVWTDKMTVKQNVVRHPIIKIK